MRNYGSAVRWVVARIRPVRLPGKMPDVAPIDLQKLIVAFADHRNGSVRWCRSLQAIDGCLHGGKILLVLGGRIRAILILPQESIGDRQLAQGRQSGKALLYEFPHSCGAQFLPDSLPREFADFYGLNPVAVNESHQLRRVIEIGFGPNGALLIGIVVASQGYELVVDQETVR